MTTSLATNLSQALDSQPSSGPSTTLQLLSDIGIGNVTIGGCVIGDNTVGFVIDTGRSVILSKVSDSAEKTLYLKF
ncbi:hypothetical protein BDV26DRAFT_293929 [Aspergillus bertholletiae]|uniref:Uncharacterized protein n=1 Tax=Aspergillus bertholletiae TaxID=1226010 RepID=A0A5N7B5E4_9EURO|nr:hypothetical protein BDV26DRAFT_293929 [Aspergillus bertholletiae]